VTRLKPNRPTGQLKPGFWFGFTKPRFRFRYRLPSHPNASGAEFLSTTGANATQEKVQWVHQTQVNFEYKINVPDVVFISL